MPLTCVCNGDYDWYFNYPVDAYTTLVTQKRRRCCSCRELIDIGAAVVRFSCWRPPANEIEERIYGDEVPIADKYLCEECGDLFWSLDELGFCVELGENMRDLAREYAEIYSKPRISKDGNPHKASEEPSRDRHTGSPARTGADNEQD